jgi:hypothetical protein
MQWRIFGNKRFAYPGPRCVKGLHAFLLDDFFSFWLKTDLRHDLNSSEPGPRHVNAHYLYVTVPMPTFTASKRRELTYLLYMYSYHCVQLLLN